MRILVVEDEQKVANALREGLEGERYDVAVERTGEGAFFRLTTEAFDLIAGIFFQFLTPDLRSKVFANIKKALKPGGILLQLSRRTGRIGARLTGRLFQLAQARFGSQRLGLFPQLRRGVCEFVHGLGPRALPRREHGPDGGAAP